MIDYVERITTHSNNIIQRLTKPKHKIEIPIVCVLNKIDEYFNGQVPQQEDLEEFKKYLMNALEKVNENLCIKVKQCIAVSIWRKYNVDDLNYS